jgi:DNA polymerase III subunit epsilon
MITSNFPSTPLDEAEFSVLDVETTGLSARNNHIIEIGIAKVRNLRIVDRYHSLVNPGCDIPYFITQFTGITNDDVYDAPYFGSLIENINKFIGSSVISAHNLSFDDSFLTYEYIRNGFEPLSNEKVCTLKIARRLFPSLRSKSLSSITAHLRLKNINAHRALGDAEVTAHALIKMIKKLKKDEGICAISDLIDYQKSAALKNQKIKISKSEHNIIHLLPNAPGIYYFINRKNEIIYVGKAKSLRDRLKSYFSPTASRKTKKIIRQAVKLKTELTNSELTALLAEAETIKIINPKHNTQLKKYGNKYFIKVTQTHKYPRLEISNHFDFDGNDYFGLFISRKRADKIMDMIDKTFAVRECTEKEFQKSRKCFLADIERCTAPCIKKSDKLYYDELKKVYEFLSGKNQTALDRLLNKMKIYSSEEKYEKAAEVKDLIELILAQTHKSALLSEPVNSANVLFEITENQMKDYVLMIAGKIFIKSYLHNKSDLFDEAIDDFYSETTNIKMMPTEEDLEKMKITLNWLIKNRNKVRIFYLKNYKSKQHLFSAAAQFGVSGHTTSVDYYDINQLTNAAVVSD